MNAVSGTRNETLGQASADAISLNVGYFARRTWFEWLFAVLVIAGGLFAFMRYADSMDVYEKGILLAAIPSAIWLAWFWRPLQVLMLVVAGLSLAAVFSYQGSLDRAETVFWLKYFLSSQSAILWMSMLFFMATVFYWVGVFAKGRADGIELVASRLVWVAITMALTGTMVRWYESYLLGADIGHIPVSNLYEVFVLFCWMTAAFYLYFEAQYKTRSHAGDQRSRGLFALVHRGAPGARNPTPGTRAQELVDEAACAGQLHWLRHLCAGGDGGLCLPDQAAGHRNTLVQACALVALGHRAVF